MDKNELKTFVEVYDPAMCCSTGVCGPDVDDALADFANDVKWLKSQGVEVKRFNLGQEPETFKTNEIVLNRLKSKGSEVLPLILINGKLVSEGGYPERKRLIEWTGLGNGQAAEGKPAEPEAFIYDDKVNILVAIGSAVAAGCEETLTAAFARGESLGLTNDVMAKAMQAGLSVRQQSISGTVSKANELLGIPENGCTPGGGCC